MIAAYCNFGSGVFLLGWNENLQPHGPLLDQFDTPDLDDQTRASLNSPHISVSLGCP